MSRPTPLLAPAYLAAAVLGLVGTWYFAVAGLANERNYVGDVVLLRPFGLTVEVLLLSGVGLVFILAEGWRQRMPYLWAHAAAVLVFGVAFAVPMFLFMRERLLNQRAAALRAQLMRNGVIFHEPGGRRAHPWFG